MYLIAVVSESESIKLKYADSIIALTKNSDDFQYPAKGYILKGNFFQTNLQFKQALENILENLDHNKFELEDNDFGNNEVERGNFYWKDGILDLESMWRPDLENGRFWIVKRYHPKNDYRNKKFKSTRLRGFHFHLGQVLVIYIVFCNCHCY